MFYSEKMSHQCDLCDYQSIYRQNLNRHKNKKHGIGQAPTTVSVGQVGDRVPNTVSVDQDGGCAPTTVSASTCKSKAPSPNQMELPEIRPLDTKQVHHPAPDQHQQVIGNRCNTSHGETEKFDGRMHNQDNQQYGCDTGSKCFKEEYITLQNDFISLLRENQKLKQEYSSLQKNFMQLFQKTKQILQMTKSCKK